MLYELLKLTLLNSSSCKSYSCLNACQLGKALDQIPVKYGDKDGHVDHACGLASYFMDNVGSNKCPMGQITNKMAIAIMNSDMKFSDKKWSKQCSNDFVLVYLNNQKFRY